MAAGYVNPFGGYAGGYHQGVGEEQAIQQGARVARQEDWQHQYMDPMQLANAQREDIYGRAALPDNIAALDPSLHMLQDRAAGSRLGLQTQYATDLGQTGGLNQLAHEQFPGAANYQSPEQLSNRADFGRSLQLSALGVRQNQAMAMQERYAEEQMYRDARLAESERRDGYRANGSGSGVNYGFDRPAPPAAPASTTPATPAAAAPAAAPHYPTAPGVTLPPDAQQRYDNMQRQHQQVIQQSGGNPQASVQPFHALPPEHQAHVIAGVSNALGVPPEQALAHIQSQPGGTPPGAMQGQSSAARYYA